MIPSCMHAQSISVQVIMSGSFGVELALPDLHFFSKEDRMNNILFYQLGI
jgi:hypothetical protein